MPLSFDWFLPTNGDSRALVGGGHSVPSDLGRAGGSLDNAGRFREPDLRYLALVAVEAGRAPGRVALAQASMAGAAALMERPPLTVPTTALMAAARAALARLRTA